MAAINRQDIISDDVFIAFEQLEKQLRSIIGTTSQLGKSSGAAQMAEDTKKLTTAEIELEKVKKRIVVEQSKQNDEYVQAAQELKKTKLATKELTGAEQRQLGTLEQLAVANKNLTTERKQLNIATAQGKQRLTEINRELDKNNKVIRQSNDALGRQKINIGNYASALQELPGPIGGIIAGIRAMTAASWAFIATPLGAIIAAITAAMALLIAAFRTFDPLLDKIEQGFAGVSALFSVLKEGIIGLVTGTGSFKGLGDAMWDAAKAAAELKRQEQDLADQTVINSVAQAKYKKQIDELLLNSKDRSKSEAERQKDIELALALEQVAFNQEMYLAKERTRIYRDNLANSKNLTEAQKNDIAERGTIALFELQQEKGITEEQIKLYADLLIAETKLENDSVMLREKAINRKNALADKQKEDEEKKREAFIKAEEDRVKEEERILLEEVAMYKSINENRYNAWRESAEKQVEDTKKLADLRLSIEQKLAKDMVSINKDALKQTEDAQKLQLEKEKEQQEIKKEIIQDSINLSKELFSGFTDLRIEQIGQELNALEFARDREIEAAGENAMLRNEIDKKYDKKKRDLQRKQAQAEKANALFQIVINTAVGVAKAIPNLPLMALAAGAGAVQAALVIAQPLPKFDKGSDNTPSDYIAGERRPELRRHRGKWELVDKPTIFTDSPGDKIISGKQTDSIIGNLMDIEGDNILTNKAKLLGLLNNEYRPSSKPENLAYVLQRNNEELIRTIQNKKEVSVSVSGRGNKVREKSGNITVNRIDYYYGR
jgi:hypothetical protein